ncbi:MAG: hypothetical protein WAU75_05665, partial [Solirubrobacteraceae bacterium]
VAPRGRPHLRRRQVEGLYEHKLSSWLAELDRTLEPYRSARVDAAGGGAAGAGSASASSGALR